MIESAIAWAFTALEYLFFVWAGVLVFFAILASFFFCRDGE